MPTIMTKRFWSPKAQFLNGKISTTGWALEKQYMSSQSCLWQLRASPALVCPSEGPENLKLHQMTYLRLKDFPGGSDGKESACNAGDLGSIPGLGRSPGGGHSNTLWYSCPENPRGQRSLAGYSPWGCKEWDTTEWLSTHKGESDSTWTLHQPFKLPKVDLILPWKAKSLIRILPGSFWFSKSVTFPNS